MQKVLWHNMETREVLSKLKVNDDRGLSQREAVMRLNRVGVNMLKKRERVSPISILFSQFKDFMVLVLIVATFISGILGQISDAITILAIVVVNALLGFIQEFKAEKSLEALKELTAPSALVLRGGKEKKMPASQLVPGDIVFLGSGHRVAADVRIIESIGLEINEAALTGESVPVVKGIGPLNKSGIQIGDMRNMAFMGTVVTRGRGRGVVIATGMDTEIGRIAHVMQEVKDEATPLQRKLEGLGRWLVNLCLGISGLLAFLGVLRGEPIETMFLTGVSLAVAAIPEGLPAIVTISLAIGVQRMMKRNAIVRKLPAVETLGCATVICSDKTGTLTQNQMTVERIFAGGGVFSVSGSGYQPRGRFSKNGMKVEALGFKELYLALQIGTLCNDALIQEGDGGDAGLEVIGDPTEAALLVAGQKGGLGSIREEFQRLREIPFDSSRKLMTVVCRTPEGKLRSYAKGAPDVLLKGCSYIAEAGSIRPMTRKDRDKITRALDDMATHALRVLAVAYKELDGSPYKYKESELERNLVFVGLFGMNDPLRVEAVEAVKVARRAGVRTIMITGDHRETAAAVGRELGLLGHGGKILTGEELEMLSDGELAEEVSHVNVYARVSPHHKLRIVRALKKQGHVVAMTGDGVNDAPAIKEADIGVAMGITGTDVTKEASALVLTDDNYATIVAAIEEGRGIYDNIRKFIRYLLACNIGELLTMLFSMLLGLPLPLVPIQILWVNLVTDGLPAIALGLDPYDGSLMMRPPRSPDEGIFARGLLEKIVAQGFAIGICTVTVAVLSIISGRGGLEYVRTMTFCTLVLAQLIYVFSCRFERYTIFSWDFFSNRPLLVSVFFSMLLQLAVVYFPHAGKIFETVPLNGADWGIVIIFSTGSVAITNTFRVLKNRALQILGKGDFLETS